MKVTKALAPITLVIESPEEFDVFLSAFYEKTQKYSFMRTKNQHDLIAEDIMKKLNYLYTLTGAKITK